jgi:hypothetical protein
MFGLSATAKVFRPRGLGESELQVANAQDHNYAAGQSMYELTAELAAAKHESHLLRLELQGLKRSEAVDRSVIERLAHEKKTLEVELAHLRQKLDVFKELGRDQREELRQERGRTENYQQEAERLSYLARSLQAQQ